MMDTDDEQLPTSSSDDDQDRPSPSMLCCAFNQDGGCLAIGTTGGFSIHNLSPYQVSVKRELPNGGIGRIEMLFRCNLLALVGGGPCPYAPPHRVMIWDDHPAKAIGELSFRQVVLSVRLRRDAVAVTLRDRVYVYHLADLNLRDKIYTADNPHGLLCVSTAVQDFKLACPSISEGSVRIELYGLRKTVLMEAHESALRALSLSSDGTRLATASVKGTVIRVWDVATSSCIQEFRRGVERADITCLVWSYQGQYLACTSDKGTAHVFNMESSKTSGSSSSKKPTMTTRFLKKVRKSIEGDQKKSISQIRGVPHPHACAFLPDAPNILAVAGWDADGNGVLLKAEFSEDTEEPRRVGYHVVAKSTLVNEDETTRRRRRLLGKVPGMPSNTTDELEEQSKLYIGERLEVLEGMKNIMLEEEDEESGFVSVSTSKPQQTAQLASDNTKEALKSHNADKSSDEDEHEMADAHEEPIEDDENENQVGDNDAETS